MLVIWSSAASCIRYCNMQMKLPDALSGWMRTHSPMLTRIVHSQGPGSCPTCNQKCILAQKEAQSSIMAKQSTASNKHWGCWLEFCATHSMDPCDTSTDFAPYPQVFGRRICDGHLTTSQKPVQSCSVSDAPQAVGQVHKRMGPPDNGMDGHRNIDL